ncbi:hypothetical protein BMF94_6521 [Rhodotorula taiwanensis]|uniref:Uncharacterized protein n=1 Tax=Rhodotorula taiwanensis TaxID=741276 RepID=A0A2S5B0Z6_9BASI|nr:hypothetical protein BMF94_6521 [Rhodotorula taiwanensis]
MATSSSTLTGNSPETTTLQVPGALPASPESPASPDTPLSAAGALLGRSDSSGRLRRNMSAASSTSSPARQHRARSRSPAPATTHSLSALHSALPLPALATTTGGTSPASSPAAVTSPASLASGSATSMLSSPGRAGPAAALSRPAPVVPPSPSIPATPAYSRPTSPHPPASRSKDEPASPVRARGESSDGAALSQSASQVDLNHIFERDVEFPTTHHITPSEAVDVAVPPVLTEAAVALSAADDDPIASRDLAALVLDAEQDAQANSGWSSPVLPAGHSLHHWHSPQQQHQQQVSSPSAGPHQLSQAAYANASRSPVRGMRSFSPDSGSQSGERAASPGSSYFSAGTPPTSNGGGSPPATSMSASVQSAAAAAFAPFSQRLAEALESEASKLPPGLTGTSAVPAAAGSQAPSSPPEASGRSDASSASRSHSRNVLSPSFLRPFPTGSSTLSGGSEDPFVASPLASPGPEASATLAPPPLSSSSSATPTPASAAISSAAGTSGLAAPHPRKLSFATYADLVNEERLAELTGERLSADAAGTTASGAQTPGAGPAGATGLSGLSRSRSGTHSSLMVEQLETRLHAAAGLDIRGTSNSARSDAPEAAAPA